MLLSLALLTSVFFTAFLLTRYFCSHPFKWISLDHPNDRSLHVSPTPRTGGLAILIGLALGLFLVSFLGQIDLLPIGWREIRSQGLLWMIGMSLLAASVSFWDDRRGVPPVVRLGVHLIAALGAVLGADLGVDRLTVPALGSLSLGVFSVPLTVLFILWMTNLYNFMDGMDGFAGGMAVFGFGFLGYFFWRDGNPPMALFSLIITAASGGFLLHNLPPAKIFMGDVGSVPIGFLSGIFAVVGMKQGLFDIWVPLLVFSPFIVDATATLLKRILKGRKVWQAHREHYYQRLVLVGLGHKKTVLTEYGLMLACGFSAVLYLETSEMWRLVLLLGWIAVYVLLANAIRILETKLIRKNK